LLPVKVLVDHLANSIPPYITPLTNASVYT
jgi:hypothetical protein